MGRGWVNVTGCSSVYLRMRGKNWIVEVLLYGAVRALCGLGDLEKVMW